MRDYENNHPHEGSSSAVLSQLHGSSGHRPQILPRNLENDNFQQSYPAAVSYYHHQQQPPNTASGYQYSRPSNIANSLDESSAIEGYPPKQHGYPDSHYQPQPLPPQSSAPLSPIHSSSVQGYSQYADMPESNPSTQRYGSSNNYQGGRASVPGGSPQGEPKYVEANTPQARKKALEGWGSQGEEAPKNEQRQPPSQRYSSSGWDESTPVAYPVDYYQQHENGPTAHHIHNSQVDDHPVRPDPNAASYRLASQESMVQPQPSTGLLRESVSSAHLHVPPAAKPLQQPPTQSSHSHAMEKPDGYPTSQSNTAPVGQHQPSPNSKPETSECCSCAIL